MIDPIYVKMLEKHVARLEKKVHRLEKEKMTRERCAAAFAEYIIHENETIEDGIHDTARDLIRRLVFYPPNGKNASNFVCDMHKRDYKMLDKCIGKIFSVTLSSLKVLGLEINVSDADVKTDTVSPTI